MPAGLLHADIGVVPDEDAGGLVLLLVVSAIGGVAAEAQPLSPRIIVGRDGVAIDRGPHGILRLPALIEREYSALVQRGFAKIVEVDEKGPVVSYKARLE